MRQHIDLAVLELDAHKSWLDDFFERVAPSLDKMKLHRLAWERSGDLAIEQPKAQAQPAVRTDIFLRTQVQLRRYDALLLPVSLETLGWTRQALAGVPRGPSVPMLGIVHELRSAAILDLLALGLFDFVTTVPCPQAFRARVINAVSKTPRHLSLREAEQQGGRPRPLASPTLRLLMQQSSQSQFTNSLANDSRSKDQDAMMQMRLAPLSVQPKASIPGLAQGLNTKKTSCAGCAVQVSAFGWPDQGFGPTKQRMVTLFERQYLKAAMLRANGNITLAASKSRKNRRAFWELLRKHGMATGFAMNGQVPLDKLSLDPTEVKSWLDAENRTDS
ncbi:MAG: hypothetical protein WAO93_06695 [Orrella sp.]|jgi:hypothetical protein